VALGVLLTLRTHVAQRYLIPSRSMEPTLHGDPRRGDIVLVDKCGLLRPHDVDRLRRFDTVVVRDRDHDGADPLVKRVVSTGDEMVKIAEGDVFVRPLSGGPWTRVQKHPIEHRDLRFTFYAWEPGGSGSEPPDHYLAGTRDDAGPYCLRPFAADVGAALARLGGANLGGEVGRVLATVRAIDTSFLDAAGRRSFAGAGCSHNDVGWEVDLELADGCLGFAVSLHQHDLVLAAACERSGRVVLGEGVAIDEPLPPPVPALGTRVTVAFGYLDGRLFLEVDGRLAALVAFPMPANRESAGNVLRLAVLGTGEAELARVHRVRLFHDVYYQPENRPYAGIREYRVEPGELFLLGDNTFDSTDSRRRGPFAAADLVGRPVAVIGPWSRARWLPR